MVEWGLQDKPEKTVEWGLGDSLDTVVLDPAEEERQIKETLDLSEQYNIPVNDSQKFVAVPEPGLFASQLGKIKEFIRERTGYFEPPIYGPEFREEKPFRTAGKMAAFYGAEAVSGLSLTALDVLTNKTVGDKTLAEAVARITGFEPTSKEIGAGESVKYIAAFTPAGKIVRAGTKLIPAAQTLKTILSSGLTFATTDAAIQFSKNITEGKPVDWSHVHAAGGVGVLWGTGEVAVAAVLSKIVKGMDKYWGEKGMDVAEKLRPPGTSLKDQYAKQQVEIRADINRAKEVFRKTGKMPEDLMKKYVHGKPPEGSVFKPPEAIPAKKPVQAPITKAKKPPTEPAKVPEAPAKAITKPKPTITPVEAKQPWEMTREEMVQVWTQPDMLGGPGKPYSISVEGEGRKTFRTREKAIQWVEKEHKNWIKEALSEGKPVPRAVLEEYKSEKWAQKALAKAGVEREVEKEVIIEGKIAELSGKDTESSRKLISEASIKEQIALDIKLHEQAIKAKSFTAKGRVFLKNDIETKKKVLDILEGRITEQAEIDEIISDIEADQEIHRDHLKRRQSKVRGSHAWHRMWINNYDKWIAEIKQLTPPAKAGVEKKKRDILGGVDPISQINKALTEAVEIRPKVEAERKVELRKRVGAAAGALKSSLTKRKISAEEAIGKSTGLLKGPLSNARFTSIRDIMEDSAPGAVDNAFRAIGDNKKLRYFEIVETKEAFAKLIDGIPITLLQVDMIKRQFGIEMGEIAKERAEKSSLSDRLWNWWRAGLLTGMKTSGLNIESTLIHSIMETEKDLIAAPVDILISQFTGKRTLGFTWKGIPSGVKEGIGKGWEYLFTGISERDIGKKLDYVPINYGNSKIGKSIQVYVESIFHLMGAEDQPFFYGAMSRSIRSQVIAQGRNEGLKGQEFKDFVEKTRLSPSSEILENATHDAEMAVFQNRTVLGDIASHIQKAPVVRWAVPFSRTPSAVAMQIINYTPIGAIKEVAEQIHKGEFDQRKFSQAIGRSVVGTPALAIGALLFAKGLMTLDYPDGERERKLWELEGKKPFAIKIGDKWRSAYVSGPVGNVLIIGAYFQKAITESGSPSEAIVTAMAGGGKSFTEQTFVIGMSRAIDAIKDPERSFDRFFTGMAGSFVPTIVADIARASDYTERIYKGPWQGIVNRIPAARTTLEERVDVFGQDLPRYGGNPLEVMIDASRPVKIRQDVVVDELRRLWDKNVKVAPTQLGNRDGYKSLTQEENAVLWRRAGEATYQSLFELIKKRSYIRKGDEVKGKLIEKEVKRAKDNARAEAAEIKLNQGITMEELKESGLVTSDVEPLIRRRR